jgi:predicted restriction endonuclease
MSELIEKPIPFNGICVVCEGSIKKGEMSIFDETAGHMHPKCYTVNLPESSTTEISIDDLYVGYEDKSNDLITKLTLEGNTDQKLLEFEANSPESTTKKIESVSQSRNPELASLMKIRHNHTCQVCEIPTFKNKNGDYYYTESHHIIPRALGGLDKPSNILIVCANCHRKFDSGDDSTLLETYRILKQKNIIENFDSLKQYNAISENLFNQLSNLD